jgi:ligand-binding sensor domain-containing protein
VSRYDGARWRLFSTADGLPSPDVRALAVGPGETPWAAFELPADGASYLAGGDEWQELTCTPTGPASLNILAAVAKADGTAWFGTDRGVSRFDGTTWTTFTVRDGLPANTVTALALAPNGGVWAATPKGLAVFGQERWTTLAHDDVRQLAIDPQGNLWALTDAGLTQLEASGLVPVSGAPSTIIRALAATQTGVWLATDSGVARLVNGEWQVYTIQDGLASNDVTALALGPDGQLWAGFADASLGFNTFDGEHWQPSALSPTLLNDDVTDILAAPDGEVWIATIGALTRYDGTEWRSLTIDNGLPFEHINQIAYAYDSIWIASGEGLARYDGASRWQVFDSADGLARSDVRQLVVAPNGQLWAGHESLNDGLSVFDGNGWQTVASLDQEQPTRLAALAFTPDGRLWAGGWYLSVGPDEAPGFYGVYVDGAGWTLQSAPEVIQGLRAGSDGRLWIARNTSVQVVDTGTPGAGTLLIEYPTLEKTIAAFELSPNGTAWLSLAGISNLYVLQGGQWQSEYAAAFHRWRAITEIAFGRDGSLWAGSVRGDGAAHLPGIREGWQYFRTASARFGTPPSGGVLALAPGPQGAVWFGTTSGGISRYGSNQSASAYVRALGPQEVRAIVPAGGETVWAATHGDGVYFYDGSRWIHHAPDPALAATGIQAFAVDSDGVAWFGTSHRVVRLEEKVCAPDRRGVRVSAQSAAADPNGGMWFATSSMGAVRWSDDGSTVWRVADRTGTRVFAAAPSTDGSVWFLGENTLTRYLDRTWQTFPLSDDLTPAEVHSLAVTAPAHAWAGAQNGAFHFDGREWRQFTTSDGLADNAVQYVTIAADGSLWFATPGGLSRYQP